MKTSNSKLLSSNPLIKIMMFVAIITNINFVAGQEEFICASPDPAGPDPAGVYSGSIATNYLENYEPKVFNVHFWGVRAPDGSSENPLNETLALKAIAILNIEYNKYNIFFKYRGISVFNSRPNQPVYYIYSYPENTNDPNDPLIGTCQILTNGGGNVIDPEGFGSMHVCEIGDFLLAVGEDEQYNTDTFNIYVPYEANGFGGTGINPYSVIIPTYNLTNRGVIIHEIAHTFKLYHTFSAYNNLHNPCEEEPCNDPPYYDSEHVTRNINDPDYNADIYGDYVTDTAAVPPFSTEYCYFNGLPNSGCGGGSPYRNYYIDSENCSYSDLSPNGDHLGIDYEIFEEDVKNYMSYTSGHCLGIGIFSPGQINRMRETIDNNVGGYFDDIDTNIAALYEPYKGTYSDGSVPVGPQIPPHFQPGFDYIFKRCGPIGDYPPPLDYYIPVG